MRARQGSWDLGPVTDPSDRWPLPHRTELRDRLLAAYAGRGYHDTRHLAEVLDRLDELTGSAAAVELVLAAFFHDAVYEGAAAPGGQSDEERSARLAEAELAGEQVDVAEVARLVRLTETHDPAPGDEAGALLCDADLAILAAPPDRYAEYVAGVRRDFAAVPDADFRAGRAAVLRDLAGRDRLFRTAHARANWEPAARANLAAELDALSG
jgi:predicted metal-dependent HD superfamily phosphohydrolase